jgi:uncharacterized protein YjbI with pentapeptide repeats
VNPEHLEQLRGGPGKWNVWRKEHPDVIPDLDEVDVSRSGIAHINLAGAMLRRACLVDCNLNRAKLDGADLDGALLAHADLSYSDLSKTVLRHADLSHVEFRNATLNDVDFTGARLAGAVFSDVDLSFAKGLESVHHTGPSSIGIDTIYRSKGKIPEVFLRGAGVPDNFILYMRSLTGAAFDFYSCFISYSTKDQDFTDRLHSDLQGKGVRCWFAPEDLKIGDKFRSRIDESIRIHDKFLLVLSQDSISSP